MKITILTHLERETAPAHDIVVDQVSAALKRAGHKVSVLGVHGDVRRLIAGLARRRPDLVFNLMEMFGRNVLGDVGVAGLLGLLNLRYTGGGPGEYYLQQDKVLTKKLLAYEGIAYPDFAVFPPGAGFETGGKLRMPLFVKPLRGDSSIGIDSHSLVDNPTDLMKRITAIHERVQDAALAEDARYNREKARLLLLQLLPPINGSSSDQPPHEDDNPPSLRPENRQLMPMPVGPEGTEGGAEYRGELRSAV